MDREGRGREREERVRSLSYSYPFFLVTSFLSISFSCPFLFLFSLPFSHLSCKRVTWHGQEKKRGDSRSRTFPSFYSSFLSVIDERAQRESGGCVHELAAISFHPHSSLGFIIIDYKNYTKEEKRPFFPLTSPINLSIRAILIRKRGKEKEWDHIAWLRSRLRTFPLSSLTGFGIEMKGKER